jgi:maltooligosyltrehalose trehalohydrolase
MDSLWNDDFHHAAQVRLTGRSEAYYSDYRGSAEEFVSVAQFGFLYQGQRSQWQKGPRGTATTGLPATSFISFLQNHDQVANSGTGSRIHQLTSPGRLRAMTTLWLLLPQTPMFFQGQEFSASAPFFYFADNHSELAGLVADGRANFLSQFPSLKGPEARQRLRNPADQNTFRDCCLDFSDRFKNAPCYALHADLLRLRREDPVFRRQSADDIRGATLGCDSLVLRYFGDAGDDRLVIVNFGCDLHYSPAPQPLLAPPEGRCWVPLWDSNRFEYGGSGVAAAETDDGWHFAGESACVLRAVPGEL